MPLLKEYVDDAGTPSKLADVENNVRLTVA
jgi:hypothetical protein